MFCEKLDQSERQVLPVFSQLFNPKICPRNEKLMGTNGSEKSRAEKDTEKAGRVKNK